MPRSLRKSASLVPESSRERGLPKYLPRSRFFAMSRVEPARSRRGRCSAGRSMSTLSKQSQSTLPRRSMTRPMRSSSARSQTNVPDPLPALHLRSFGAFARFRLRFFPDMETIAPALQVYYLSGASHYVYVTSGLPRIRQKPQRYLVFTEGLLPLPKGDRGPASWCSTISLIECQPPEFLATDQTPVGRLRCVPILTTPAALHNSLARQVYGGGLEVAMRWPIRVAGSFALLALICGSTLDRKRRKRFREGIWLRGPKIVSPRAYNRQTKGDGIEIELA
jgi:hypothetical protein